ncbi:MAG: KAP family P-loop NTPase fold protein [Brevundimonas sp.]
MTDLNELTITSSAKPHPLDGDRPLISVAEDRLGFSDMAAALAQSILAQTPTPGLVVGLEGAWGSGKSSLLNLTLASLRELAETKPLKVLEFRPWLIGDRDQLLGALFSDLAAVIDTIEADQGDLTGKSLAGSKAVAEGIRQFASRLAGPGKLIAAAGVFVPGAQILGEILKTVGETASVEAMGPSLASLKDKVAKSLEALGVPVVVTIDDVDRLEPAEVLELLRLVRSVADLPNVIYVLCYDHEVLAKAVQSAASVADGAAFLEKIVQVVVQAPIPESYDLRFWFAKELDALIGTIGGDEAARIQQVIDGEGGRRLTTPRAVVRALNSLRFDLPAVIKRVDLADLVWLHLIKSSNTRLYRWIEAYCAAYAATAHSRAHLSKGGNAADNTALTEILAAEGRVLQDEIYSLAHHLPGIRRIHVVKEEVPTFVWGEMSAWERDNAILKRRLASPDHYRLFFALAVPQVAPQAADFIALSEALHASPEATEALLLQWGQERSPLGVSRLELVFDRLRAGGRPLTSEEFKALWSLFQDRFDGPLATVIVNIWGGPKLWSLAEPIIEAGFRNMPARQRNAILTATFKRGKALGWLAELFRGQLFAHDRVEGERSHGPKILSEDALDKVTPILMGRFASAGALALLSLPEGMSALLAWVQGAPQSHDSPARTDIRKRTRTIQGLMTFLPHIRSRSRSTGDDGINVFTDYFRRENIALFFDYDVVINRLEAATSNRSLTVKTRAKELLDEIALGSR